MRYYLVLVNSIGKDLICTFSSLNMNSETPSPVDGCLFLSVLSSLHQ